jgi:hypothetical protein
MKKNVMLLLPLFLMATGAQAEDELITGFGACSS